MKTAFLYTDRYFDYDYGEIHPLKIERLRLTFELCKAYGLFELPEAVLIETNPATESEILRFHTPEYVRVLREASQGTFRGLYPHGLGPGDNPIFEGLWEWSLLHTGATLQCAKLVADKTVNVAFNIAGGLHHAGPDRASGFCYVNDVGIAITYLLGAGRRVAFVDVDAHHCNAVQEAFYTDDRVLVVSLHESGETLYPWGGYESEIGDGPGRGFNVNVPLLAGTDDEVYVEAFRQVVPPILKAFAPDIVLAELGADTMISDPLTHLRLTNNGYYAVVRDLCSLSPALVGLGGGGYDVYRSARCWTLAWSAMSEIEPEEDFAGLVGGEMYGLGMESLFDRPILTQGEAKDRARRHAEAVVARLRETVFPILGAEPP